MNAAEEQRARQCSAAEYLWARRKRNSEKNLSLTRLSMPCDTGDILEGDIKDADYHCSSVIQKTMVHVANEPMDSVSG